jgi:hypothetical protein
VRALVSSLAVLLVLPGAAGAATVSVEPFVERLPPGDDGFGSCSRYMMCPPDMVVFAAAAGEPNQLTISEEPAAYPRTRFLVRDEAASVQAGAGCEQIDAMTVACTAATVGPVQLGDGDDRIATGRGYVSGGDGADALNVSAGLVDGDEGDDVVIGLQGGGGGGDDLLMVTSGRGDSGDDDLRCFPRKADFCHLDGGPGNDLVTGGESSDRLFGRARRRRAARLFRRRRSPWRPRGRPAHRRGGRGRAPRRPRGRSGQLRRRPRPRARRSP